MGLKCDSDQYPSVEALLSSAFILATRAHVYQLDRCSLHIILFSKHTFAHIEVKEFKVALIIPKMLQTCLGDADVFFW